MNINWRHWEAVTVTLAGGFFAVFLLSKYALSLFFPFLFSLALAVLTRPLVKAVSRRTGCSERLSAVLVTAGALMLLFLFCYLLCNRLYTELENLISFLLEDSENPAGKTAGIIAFFRGIRERLPFLEKLRSSSLLTGMIGDPEAYLAGQLQGAISSAATWLAGFAARLLRGLPGLLFLLLVTGISCFYFAVEYPVICRAILHCFPPKIKGRIPEWRRRFFGALRRCARAYFLLFLLTLSELLVGFLFLGVEYAFLLAFFSALLDILPVLGVGTVLLPWALFLLATGEIFRGVGLLLLYVAVTVVRQIAEPHLVGKSIGLHPLLLLISFYAGVKLFGIAGVFLGPLLAFLLKELFSHGKEDTGEKEKA